MKRLRNWDCPYTTKMSLNKVKNSANSIEYNSHRLKKFLTFTSTFSGVIDQVEEAFAAEEEMRLNREMQKEMTAIDDDIK